jgi:histidine triad (HIT) family protein
MEADCTFCQIVLGEASAEIVYQDDLATAFKDIHPGAPVHYLLVPNRHLGSVNDIDASDEPLLGHLFTVARDLAAEIGIDESGYRLIVNTGPNANQTIFHLHLHLLGGAPMRYPMG